MQASSDLPAGDVQGMALSLGHPFALADPGDLVRQAQDVGSRVMLQVTTVAQKVQAAERGVDIIIAQGGEAGGYAGDVSTMALVPARNSDQHGCAGQPDISVRARGLEHVRRLHGCATIARLRRDPHAANAEPALSSWRIATSCSTARCIPILGRFSTPCRCRIRASRPAAGSDP
jgi:Nitronate monooxygenase